MYDDEHDDDMVAKAAKSGAPDPQSIWDSEEALEGLVMERSTRPELTSEQLTKKLLEEAGPAAASSIIHIALHSSNDNTRLNAAKYITDKVYDDQNTGAKASWEDLVADVVSQAEIHANMPGSGDSQ